VSYLFFEHPALLRQFSALSFEYTVAGNMRINVPQSAGHDDLAMATCLAATSLPEASGLRTEPQRTRFAGPSTGYELAGPLRVPGPRMHFAAEKPSRGVDDCQRPELDRRPRTC
jgi:hypothetical protein